jgi:hypothetical protein
MPAIDRVLFRETMLREFRAAWYALRSAHPNERFYAFGFYTAPCAEYLMVTASTEEGLSAATARYTASKGCDPDLMRTSLRWNPCDSPLHEECQTLLPKSDALRTAGPDPYEETPEAESAVALVFEVAIDVLKELDREGLFGSGLERDRLVLGIWMGDQPDEDRVDFARQLNSEAVVERFTKEMDDANEAFLALSG